MIIAILNLPAHLRLRLVNALECGRLAPPFRRVSLQAILDRREGLEALIHDLDTLFALGLTGGAAAAWIRTVTEQKTAVPRTALVWSGPEVPGLFSRDTRQVFDEWIGHAARSIWMSTYAFFDGPKAFEGLARRLDALPGLQVTLILNIQRKRGDTTPSAQLVQRFAERLWRTEWPGTARPRVFYDPRALEMDGPAGVLHAKALVVDEEKLLVTSANLTEAAFDRNIELGLLVHDHALALSTIRYFQGLIDTSILHPLP